MDEQRSVEWFSSRKGRVTGSMVGAILGLNPWMTRDDAMRSMVRDYHGAPREFEGNIATQWGVANEAGAVAEYEMETGFVVRTCGFYTYEDWLGASPDGLVNHDGLVEIKCPFWMKKGNGEFKSASEQMHYYAQIQIQLFVTGREWCSFYQWSPSKTAHEVVKKDSPFLDETIPLLHQFYAEYLHERKHKFQRHIDEKRAIIDNIRSRQMVVEYDELNDAIDRATKRKSELVAEMAKMSDNKNAIFGGRYLTNITRDGSVSYAKALKVLAPGANLAPWTGKPVSYWSLK
jgi:putative phage-type endonuclease